MAWLSITPKIQKLVPVLGSPADGEALGACRAIGRVLHGARLDFHDFAARVAGGHPEDFPTAPRRKPTARPARGPRPSTFTEKQSAQHRSMARWCFENRDRLKPKEREFIAALIARRRELTIPQMEWLVDITDRLEKESRP